MSETRFFKNFPSFACKALAESLGSGFSAHTSKPYVFGPGGLRVDYLRATRGHYVPARVPTRRSARGGVQDSLRSSRRVTPSFAKMRYRCPSTVRTETLLASAISRFE